MDKRKFRRNAVEIGKDLLILLLTCSALWMLGRGGLFQRLELREQTGDPAGVQDSTTDRTRAATPLRITATLSGGESVERCTLQYDVAAVDTFFHQSAGLLMEALSAADAPEQVEEAQWQQALQQAPGLCMDFYGEMPLSVLTGRLGGDLSIPDVTVRRLLLTVWQGNAALYYCDEQTGLRYRCATRVVSAVQLASALEGLTADGSYYAFESEQTHTMDPDTLLAPNVESLPVCLAENPAAAGRASLEGLMEDLGFNLSGCVFYSAAGDEVARSGSDTVRLSADGVVEYSGGEGTGHFRVDRITGESGVYAAVEACRALLERVAVSRCCMAGFCLSGVETTAAGWKLTFSYTLNGAPVTLSAGPAAEFTVSDGSITGITLRLRSYTNGEQSQLILPPVQAAAAMSALSLEGRELTVTYPDRGEEELIPQWTALSR